MATTIDAKTPQLKVVKAWFDAFIAHDSSKIGAVLSKDFAYQTLPESIGLPEETKEQHIQRYERALTMINKFEFIFHEVIDAPGKVIIHATSTFHVGGTKSSTDNFAIVSLAEEDGELKIIRAKEFADPERYSSLMAGVGA